ncbi:MAG: hypothetical protein M0R73_03420 [Dehalococcoidia bacterium]|nr:hypothetical protein [Dehalococcoidia bacterium]
MRRLFERLPRFMPSIIVGLVVTGALAFAFSNLWIGFAVGASVAIFLAWEEGMHPRR